MRRLKVQAMTQIDFTSAEHTIVLSDIHLANAESVHPTQPLWKRFRLQEHFIDQDFRAFLGKMRQEAAAPIELILNGDIFDFDSVMTLPPPGASIHLGWLERARGISSEEPKSRFKMKEILKAHPVWVDALSEFILAGNRVIFVIGNHDLELHWPGVQYDLLSGLKLPESLKGSVRFCEWFYISNKDTLIEHGNQYDAYCLCSNPIHPLINKGGRVLVRLPFGNIAGKYMLNGMGLMNPHASGSFIKNSTWEYIFFYYKYVMRTQPFLLWTWFWSALATLFTSLREGYLPAMRDPLTVDTRIEEIAQRANASVSMVLSLKEVHVHPAIFSPIKILRELWLDRAILLGLIIFGSFQFFSFLNVFSNVSLFWFLIPIILLIPCFIFYARSVQSEVNVTQETTLHLSPLSAKITKVKRIVQGHTHQELHNWVEGVEFLNTGTWSPAFHDVECTLPFGRKCFAWIRPHSNPAQSGRIAELYEWRKDQAHLIVAQNRKVEQRSEGLATPFSDGKIKEVLEIGV
jgi:UDP-2,3-diacylglucosamine pyrophosphatase LpxH